jgi:phosphate starvation-inducible PhoH-like protein
MAQKLNLALNGRPDSRKKQRVLKPKSENQAAYIRAIEEHDIVFALGCAGCGKTHIAAGMAAKLLKSDTGFARIVGVRPAVETGGVHKSLGYLPGDLDDKIHPYLKPLLKELEKFIGEEDMRKYRQGENPIIELSPLQYMRGTTFEDSIVILDEAQNATYDEMWMFLTRLGYGSKLIINGDNTKDGNGRLRQSDLPLLEQGALDKYSRLLSTLPEVKIITMEECDICRHPLVRKMMALTGEGF